jgi:hypothetical protein
MVSHFVILYVKDYHLNYATNTKTETIKWMFAIWIGQIATTLGIIYHFLKR